MFKNTSETDVSITDPRFIKIGLFLFFVFILFGILESKTFEIKYKDRFYPGIFIGGEYVGGKTYSEVLNSFKEKKEKLEKNGLNANFTSSRGIQKVNIPMSVIGTTPDNSVEYFSFDGWENNLEEAYSWGHNTNLFLNLKEQTILLFTKKYFNFTNSIHREVVDPFLEDRVYNFLNKSAPAVFSFTSGKITILKEVEGESVNREEVLNILEQKLNLFDTIPIIFTTDQDFPVVTKEKLEPFLDSAEIFTKGKNIVFQYKGREWKIKETQLISWLTVNTENAIDINQIKLEDYLANTVTKFIDSPPQNSRFKMQDGKLIETVPGKPGNIVDVDDVLEKIKKVIFETNVEVKNSRINIPIKTIEVEPKVTQNTVDKYNIVDIVGEIRTSFDGSTANREHNIKIGISMIDGMIIPPGAEFSTVASIGRVTAKEGYLKELVIKENKTTKEYGGGLCQIATTLFRLALNAGLPITERQNHRFVVHYYDPPGLDATIYGPHPDFRFVNDTNNYLLLQARVENKQVIMELYGQKDGRSSEISEATLYNRIPAPPTKYVQSAELPVGQTKCTEVPHDGVTTDVLYTIKYLDGTIKERNFHSIYQPWQKVCLIGTAL
ncbi:MAG: VanW family protein [Candidatus Paceibacterota bacterium]|jgi:vancomycin resistance protein YoaR